MAPISLRDPKFEELAEEFVRTFTHFKRGSKNFQLSVQYALSNFRYHRFLDVDETKVQREIDGVCQKIQVHSQEEEADSLKTFCEQFLGSPFGESAPKSYGHYAVLSLLLNLSGSPTNVRYQPKLKQDLDEEEFDWRAYLLEDAEEEVIGIPSGNQLDWDWSEEEEEEPDVTSDSGVSVGLRPDDVIRVGHGGARDEEETLKSDSSLSESVVRQYWMDEIPQASGRDSSESGHFSIVDSWNDYRRNHQPFYHHEQRRTLTETQVVRETLWMLSGVQASFVYNFRETGIDIRDDVQVAHLTPESLLSSLRSFASTGEHSRALQHFLSCVLFPGGESVANSQTYQALAGALSSYFKGYKAELSSVEKAILTRERSVTLLTLQQNHQPRSQEIAALYSVFHAGVLQAVDLSPPEKTARLFDVLHRQIVRADSLGSSARWKVSLLLHIFLQTVQPCANFVDKWVTSGVLADPCGEFFIETDKKIDAQNTSFWKAGVVVKKIQDGGDDTNVVPNFLMDLVRKIICAGKSVSLINGLGKMAYVKFTSSGRALFTNFIDELHSRVVAVRTNDTDVRSPVGSHKLADRDLMMSSLRDIGDPLLVSSLLAPSPLDSNFTRCDSLRLKMKEIASGVETVLEPLERILSESLGPLIEERYRRACRNLFHLLNADYNLTDHLVAMRSFFLLEAGETMHQFYVDIFSKIRRQEEWRDLSYLNSSIQESLQARFPQFIDRLSVRVKEDLNETEPRPLRDSLSELSLNYQVPWPVSIVIDSSHQKKYNKVFRFLLTVKRAKWSLDELCFKDLETGKGGGEQRDAQSSAGQEDHGLMQCVFVLRFKLLHFVNSLHTYIMTRILHTTVLEFQRSLEKTRDLDQLIEEHKSYVDNVYDRCLLSDGIGLIREAILKALNMALDFQLLWDSAPLRSSLKAFEKLEAEFLRCRQFIVTFLGQLVKRGVFPHLEALACALSTDLSGIQVAT